MAGNCSPPYCISSSNTKFCDCQCEQSCCPPCPCLKSITWRWQVGTTEEDWGGGDPNEGCDCASVTPTPTSFASPIEYIDEFPDFPVIMEDEYESSALNSDFVFALSSHPYFYCNYNCLIYSLILQTSGCCIFFFGDIPVPNNESGGVFEICGVAIGEGTLSVINGTALVCENSQQFRTYFKTRETNQQWEERAYGQVENCECFCIRIVPPAEGCCVACYKDMTYVPLNETTDPLNCPGIYQPCTEQGVGFMKSKRKMLVNKLKNGKIRLNKNLAVENIMKRLKKK